MNVHRTFSRATMTFTRFYNGVPTLAVMDAEVAARVKEVLGDEERSYNYAVEIDTESANVSSMAEAHTIEGQTKVGYAVVIGGR